VKDIIKGICLTEIFLLLFTANIFADELSEIRRAINQKHAKWTAGITSISILPLEVRRKMLGGGITVGYPEERNIPSPLKVDYPPELDWRNHNGMDFTTPVKDQGTCGSCWAFGTLATLEAVINVNANSENPEIDLAEQELLSCSPGSCNGYKIDSTCMYVRDYGVSEEACFPYTADDNIPCSERCDEAPFTNRKIESFDWCYNSIDGLKEHLQYGPIGVRFQVYEDFYSYTGGIYEYVWGTFQGWHIVGMIGWSDSDSCWLVKNSWGENWGEEGYFRIAYGECSIEDFAVWMIPQPSSYPYIKIISTLLDDSNAGDGDGILNPGETADLYITLKNDPGWSDAFYTDGTTRTSESGIVFVDSNSVYGTIESGSTSTNTSDPFTIYADSTIEPGEKTFNLYVTAVGDSGDNYWVERPFIIDIGWSQYGWPVTTGSVKTSPCITDLTQNNREEVIFGCDNAFLYSKNYKAEDISGFPLNLGNKIWGSPACGDVDNNGTVNIVAASFNGNIYLIENDGTIIFSIPTGGPVTATPALFDLDNNGELEIVVGSFSNKLYVLKSDGTSYGDSFPFSSPDGAAISSGVTLCDVDEDNKREIIYTTLAGNIYALEDNGTLVPGWPYHLGGQIYGAPSSANLDGTGIKIAVGSTNDTLVVLNGDGSLYLQVVAQDEIRTSPSFADIDDDNDLEIFFGSSDSTIYCYHHNGNPAAGWPFTADSPVKSSPCFSDIENDGMPEIIAASENGTVYLLDGDGTIIAPSPLIVPPSVTSPAVSDIDMDGDEEIILGTSEGVSVLDYKKQSGSEIFWNMFRCNRYRTGNYEDKLTALQEKTIKKDTNEQIFPNPFRTSLSISLSQKTTAPLSVSIYTITGRKIRSFRVKRNTGIITWDGKTDKGRLLPSGIYFISVKSAKNKSETVMKKVIKLR
jgi:hypothetical protein